MLVPHFTYKDISIAHNIPEVTLKKYASLLSVKGKNLSNGSTKHFTQSQVDKIISLRNQPTLKNHKRKINIIDLYNEGVSCRHIARSLRISERRTYETVKEYNESGYIIVESQINLLY